MKTGVWSFEVFLVYVVILRSAESNISAWSKPVISTTSGSATLVEKINEGTTNIITITATTDKTISAYNIDSQTPKNPVLAIGGTTGVVTVTSGTVSYSSAASFILVVSATDADGTATATVTLNVNAAPAIAPHNSSVCIQDASAHGVSLIELTATDANSGTHFAWAISSGNTGSAFEITTGRIAVATGKTLHMATTASYTLVITAADDISTPLTATTTVTASVQTTCPIAASVHTTPPNSAAAVAISLETAFVVFLVKGVC